MAFIVLTLPVAGFYALGYWQSLSARLRRLRARWLAPAVTIGLREQRATVLRLLDEARAAYAARG